MMPTQLTKANVALLIGLLGLYLHGSSTDCPAIVSRTTWGARDPISVQPIPVFPVTTVMVHHTEGAPCSNLQRCSALLQALQAYQMDQLGWMDIGWNFFIDDGGLIYEGRGWDVASVDATALVSSVIATAFIGNYSENLPSDSALSVLPSLCTCGVDLGKLSSSYSLVAHRDVASTTCPGDALYDYMPIYDYWIGP